MLTFLSNLGERRVRADARRNAQRILDATAELIAADPAVSLEQVAAHAHVSRATLYHHFTSRDALMDALTQRSINEVKGALEAARPHEGSAGEAMERALLRSATATLTSHR